MAETPDTYVEDLVADSSMLHSERWELISGHFRAQPDRGVAAALRCALEGSSRVIVSYGAEYLSFLPGLVPEKTRVGARLRREPELLPAVSPVLPWLPDELIAGYLDDHLDALSAGRAWPSLLYDIGTERPAVLRRYADRFAGDPTVQRAVLAGAPDPVADEYLRRWRTTDDPSWLHDLACLRTERAAANLASARTELADPGAWDVELEFAGRLPDSGEAAGPWPAFRGFVLAEQESPHALGGIAAGEVPICADCELPAAPLLRLAAPDLPYQLRGGPSFFWYACDCDETDALTTRETDSGVQAFDDVPVGPPEPDVELAPGRRSLVLRPLPHRYGVSLDGLPGNAAHQVGGLPTWIERRAHPTCPECNRPMPHLATVDSGRTPYGDMRFEGMAFCFWCDACNVGTTIHQS